MVIVTIGEAVNDDEKTHNYGLRCDQTTEIAQRFYVMLYENSWYWRYYGYYSETPPDGHLVLQPLFWLPATRGLSRRGNRRLHSRERPLLTGNIFGRLAKRPYIFL